MAPRNKTQLMADYREQYKKDFDVSPFSTMTAGLAAAGMPQSQIDKVVETAVVQALRLALPTGKDEEVRDWAAEFIADDSRANAVTALKRAVNTVAEMLANARKDGSRLTIEIDLLAAEDRVKLNNKPRRTRTNYSRVYDAGEGKPSLGAALHDNNIDALYVKVAGEQHKFALKYGAANGATSGAQFRHNNKWNPIGLLKQTVKEMNTAAKESGKRDTASVNVWGDVKVGAESGSDSIGELYDDAYPQVVSADDQANGE